MAHAILDLLNKPYNLIRPVADRPGHDRCYALNWTRFGPGLAQQPQLQQAIEKTVR